EDRAPAAKQPTGLKPDTGAAARHLHATGVRLEQLAMHHLPDQLRPVQAGPVLRVRDPFGENPGPILDEGAVGQLDGLQASRAELAADRATEIALHGSSTVGVGLRFGRVSPTMRITMPGTGPEGRTVPPRSGVSQGGRKCRTAGTSDV